MRTLNAILGAAAIAAATFPCGAKAGELHSSRVFVLGANIATDGPLTAFVAHVGESVHLSIKYEIGTLSYPDGGGTATLESNDFTNPEYGYFCPPDETCDMTAALPVIMLDPASGRIIGRADKPGRFIFSPAVRDRDNGEPYRGKGAWDTLFVTSEGKTWSEAKYPVVLIVLPPPDPGNVDLQCTFDGASRAPLLLTLDFKAGYAEILGDDGKLGGIYQLNNPDSDVIGWSSLPKTGVNGVALNRTNGSLTANFYDVSKAALTAHCAKRSTKREF